MARIWGSPGGGHYAPITQINARNVSRLEQTWVHRSGDYRAGTQSLTEEVTMDDVASRPTSFMVTPILVQDTLYYCTSFNRVFALDPATGQQRWVYDPGVDMSKETITNCRGLAGTALLPARWTPGLSPWTVRLGSSVLILARVEWLISITN